MEVFERVSPIVPVIHNLKIEHDSMFFTSFIPQNRRFDL